MEAVYQSVPPFVSVSRKARRSKFSSSHFGTVASALLNVRGRKSLSVSNEGLSTSALRAQSLQPTVHSLVGKTLHFPEGHNVITGIETEARKLRAWSPTKTRTRAAISAFGAQTRRIRRERSASNYSRFGVRDISVDERRLLSSVGVKVPVAGVLPRRKSSQVRHAKVLDVEMALEMSGAKRLEDVRVLHVEDQDIAAVGDLSALSELRTLKVSVNKVSLNDFASCRKLEVVELNCCGQTGSERVRDNAFPCLRTLKAGYNALDVNFFACLAKLPALQHLSLAGNGIEQLPALDGDCFPQLRTLSLCHNRLSSTSDWLVLARLPCLERLDLSYNMFNRIPSLAELKELNQKETTKEDQGERQKTCLFERLEQLNLGFNRISNEEHCTSLADFLALRHCILTGNFFVRDVAEFNPRCYRFLAKIAEEQSMVIELRLPPRTVLGEPPMTLYALVPLKSLPEKVHRRALRQIAHREMLKLPAQAKTWPTHNTLLLERAPLYPTVGSSASQSTEREEVEEDFRKQQLDENWSEHGAFFTQPSLEGDEGEPVFIDPFSKRYETSRFSSRSEETRALTVSSQASTSAISKVSRGVYPQVFSSRRLQTTIKQLRYRLDHPLRISLLSGGHKTSPPRKREKAREFKHHSTFVY